MSETEAPNKGGRPPIDWPEDLVTDICDHLTTGKSLLEIGSLPGYPSAASMYRHMHRDEGFATAIAQARQAQQDYQADYCVQMADAATVEDHQVVKLRIWARQWRAAKLAPKRYGEKVALTGGDDGDKPLTVVIRKPE